MSISAWRTLGIIGAVVKRAGLGGDGLKRLGPAPFVVADKDRVDHAQQFGISAAA